MSHETEINRRDVDKIRAWGYVLVPTFVLGGMWVTLNNRIDRNAEIVIELSTKASAMDQRFNNFDSQYSVAIAKATEQISSINKRTERIEDLLQQTLYQVSKPSKSGK